MCTEELFVVLFKLSSWVREYSSLVCGLHYVATMHIGEPVMLNLADMISFAALSSEVRLYKHWFGKFALVIKDVGCTLKTWSGWASLSIGFA